LLGNVTKRKGTRQGRLAGATQQGWSWGCLYLLNEYVSIREMQSAALGSNLAVCCQMA
jgi:hypothetical protein